MIIKKATYKKVRVVQNRQVTEDVYGCDCCRKKIENYPNETQRLEVKVFHKGDSVEYYHLCSWKCVFKFIPTIKSSYFVDLPFLYYDEGGRGKDSNGIYEAH